MKKDKNTKNNFNYILAVLILIISLIAMISARNMMQKEDNISEVETKFVSESSIELSNTLKSYGEEIITVPHKIDDIQVEKYEVNNVEYVPEDELAIDSGSEEEIIINTKFLALSDGTPSDNLTVKKVVFVDYTSGKDLNDGLTPNTALKTLAKAYQKLDSNLEMEEQYIVIIGKYDETLTFYNEVTGKGSKSTVFTKNATITGKYNGINYGSSIKLFGGSGTGKTSTGTFLYGDTTFENIGIRSTSTSLFLYCQSCNLTMGEGVDVTGMATVTDDSSDTGTIKGKVANIDIIAGWSGYGYTPVTPRHDVTKIVIKSGSYKRILGGNRQGVATAALYCGFTAENPFNVEVTIDVPEMVKDHKYTVNSIFGGQTEGSVYENIVFNLKNGKIGRFCGGSIGNDVQDGGKGIPGNTFFGSTKLNMYGGSIDELYGGSLGRARVGYNKYDGSYQYGKIEINMYGGTINGNLYGAGAGAITGYSSNSTDKYKNLALNKTMKDIDGNSYRLDQSEIKINIYDGTVNGSIYGAGYGYSTLTATQIPTDGGTLYGNSNVNIYGGTITGSVYGAGAGETKYGSTRANLAQVYGNVSVNIENSPLIKGSVYGGGEGFSIYPDMAKVIGSANVTISGNAVIQNNIYGAGANSKLDGNVSVNISDITFTGDIFGGGNLGIVTGDVEVTVNSGSYQDIYTGGNQATVANSKLLINGGEIQKAFAGGNAASLTNSNIEIKDGKVERLYGGGNLADVTQSVINVLGGNITFLYGGGHSGKVTSNVDITIANGQIENLYGGGNEGDVVGKINILVNSGDITTIYGGCNSANVGNSVELNLLSGTFDTIYGGNNVGGKTNGKITILVGDKDNKPTITKLYGGGNYAEHNSDIDITINNLDDTMDYLFGGGHDASVNGSTEIIVNSGKYNNIFRWTET